MPLLFEMGKICYIPLSHKGMLSCNILKEIV